MGISRFPIRPGVDLRNINSASPCRWPAGMEKPPGVSRAACRFVLRLPRPGRGDYRTQSVFG